jgi:ribosomal protein L11 methyltransferase
MIQPLPAATFTPIPDQNWMEAWKEHYKPIPIGRRLIILPAWLDSPDESRLPIKIDPGMAFGTGTHPTTQLCMDFIESLLYDQASIFNRQSIIENRQFSVIDVGCGSGILSIAALKLGANFALGVDIDEVAIRASRENAAANGIPEASFALGVGSVQEVLDGKFGVRAAPLVLANILAPIIIRLFAAGMANLVAPGGAIVLSGILQEQADAVQTAAEGCGLELVERKQMGDWVALLLVKSPLTSTG